MPRFSAALEAERATIWQLSELCKVSGLCKKYGLTNKNFTGELEAKKMTDELTGILACAIALDTQARWDAAGDDKRVGRPRDFITPNLAPQLLSFFLRIQSRGGRHSVATGDKSQTEAGSLFDFFKAVVQPINEYLLENGRRPLSPGRMARFALKERRREACLIELKLEKSVALALRPDLGSGQLDCGGVPGWKKVDSGRILLGWQIQITRQQSDRQLSLGFWRSASLLSRWAC